MSHHAILETAHDLGVVIIGDGPAGALRMNAFNIRQHLFNRPHQCQRRIDRMRGKITHIAICHAGTPPVMRDLRVGQKILGMFAAEPCNLPDRPVGQKVAGKLACRRADIVEACHVGNAGSFGGGHHGACVLQRVRQRLFTQDGFAKTDCRLGDVAV